MQWKQDGANTDYYDTALSHSVFVVFKLDPAGSGDFGFGSQPDPEILDLAWSGSQRDPQFLDPAGSGPDPQNLPDIRPDLDPVHP